MASLGLLLCPVGAVTYSVMPTVPPSSKESDKEGDLIWYLLTISQQNTNGLGRCQENGGHRGHSLCCMKVPCSAGKCNVRTDTWWPHLHAISQGPRTEASPMSDALQHQDICSLSLGYLCHWKSQRQGSRVLTAACIPISMAGVSRASCQSQAQSPQGEGWALPTYSHPNLSPVLHKPPISIPVPNPH